MPLEAGTKFGPYAIVAPIRSGSDGDAAGEQAAAGRARACTYRATAHPGPIRRAGAQCLASRSTDGSGRSPAAPVGTAGRLAEVRPALRCD